MTKEVIVKRNKYGIKLILDNHIPFPELLQLITDKFKETGNFLKMPKWPFPLKEEY